jgi:hypothetical protein
LPTERSATFMPATAWNIAHRGREAVVVGTRPDEQQYAGGANTPDVRVLSIGYLQRHHLGDAQSDRWTTTDSRNGMA